ncbi:AAA family ATPase [Streptomyces sp. SAS_270]|uniref:AAA family ATPase n=1 Tax=Streptomyces sp. SAS_270 TaxID=3412748 RepID=UPI00403CD7F6
MTMVGTTAAVRALDDALADCTAGQLRTVLVEGPTGCGKSSVLHAVIERAGAAGAVVLCAVGTPAERATPLGVLRQLAGGDRRLTLPPTPCAPAGVQDDTADGDGGGGATAGAGAGAGVPRMEDMQAFCLRLRELSAQAPVVVCVDDVHDADDASLGFVQYLARHARAARILVVVTGCLHHEKARHAFTTELMRQPAFRRIVLGRLTPQRAAALAEAAGRGADAAFLYETSGGNPLLLRALLQEQPSPGREVEVDGPFTQAVGACLHRAGPRALAVARACALLQDAADEAQIAELLTLPGPAVAQQLAALAAAGLSEGVRLRHPALRAAVVHDTPPAQRAALHRRAAALLHRRRPAMEAARHLLAAAACESRPHTATAAETEVLCEAAESRLAHDDGAQALALLELAHRECADAQQREAVALRLARVSWRVNPAAAERRLAGPLAALDAGTPAGEHAQPLAQLLLLQGRLSTAAHLLGEPDSTTQPPDPGAETGASALDVMLDAGAPAAERLLRSATLTEATLGCLVQVLHCLLWSEHPERAVPWSRALAQDAEERGAPGWSAVFATVHAQALLRLGDLAGAATLAEKALSLLPERHSGAFPYAATAVLVRAHDAMGHYTEASRHCDRPLPPGLLESLHGLAFLRARGLHHLTGNQPQAALADFLTLGRILAHRRLDRPAYLPWRTDAAQALRELGRPQQAERLALQQLALPDARRPWVRGLSLHQRALAAAPGAGSRRITLLEQAVEELHRSGDRLATARAMADLGQHTQSEGNAPMKGTATVRAAWNLARECGATTLCKEILPDAPLADTVRGRPHDTTDDRLEHRLSSSEQRVATLAAQGLTNREISAKLYLTVSTVEQHLTKVYRKLHISGRGDLPMDLALGGPTSHTTTPALAHPTANI